MRPDDDFNVRQVKLARSCDQQAAGIVAWAKDFPMNDAPLPIAVTTTRRLVTTRADYRREAISWSRWRAVARRSARFSNHVRLCIPLA